MEKEVHDSNNDLHDLIVPTVNEAHNEDDHYGVARYFDEKDEQSEQINNWGMW